MNDSHRFTFRRHLYRIAPATVILAGLTGIGLTVSDALANKGDPTQQSCAAVWIQDDWNEWHYVSKCCPSGQHPSFRDDDGPHGQIGYYVYVNDTP